MRKHLIGAILVLAALAACNKEVDTPAPAVDNGQEEVTPGKVTLTFKATIDEGTRTSYDENLQGSWLPNDAISVCVTDRKNNYQTAVFTTEDGEIFSGQVSAEYTTIVSGVYPANDKHVFDLNNGKVTSVYLSDTYSLGTANDGGTALPMVGEMEKGVFTFHHICGALKIEVIDIFNALTFTTAESITGNFELTSEGRIEIPADGEASTVTFNYDRLSTNPVDDERGNRTFYIPVPDGTLTPGATMALKKRSNNNLTTAYEKTTTNSIQFTSNVIKRLPAIGLEHKNANSWKIVVTEPDDPDTKGAVAQYVPTGTTFIRLFTTLNTFNSDSNDGYHGSVAEFIEKKGLTNTTYTGSKNFTMSNPISSYYGKKYVILTCEVNTQNGRMVTFNYRKLEYEFASAEYVAWLGNWNVSDGTNTDTWTITRKQNNQTYTITGIAKRTNNKVTADFDNGELSLSSQLLPEKYNSKDFYLLARGTAGVHTTTNRHIMSMSLSDGNTAVVSPDMTNSAAGYGFYTNTPDSDTYSYVVRRSFGSDINITMERVTETE